MMVPTWRLAKRVGSSRIAAMPRAADGSTIRPAWSWSRRMPAMIDASWISTASSAMTRRSSRTSGIGYRPATPSAMVFVESVVTTRRSCQERVSAGALRLDADHLDSRRQRLQHMTHTGCQGAAAKSNQYGVERWRRVNELESDGRRALARLDVQAVFEEPNSVVLRDGSSPLTSQLVVTVHQFQPGAQCADAIELGRGREAGRNDRDVNSPTTARPRERLPEVARAGAHHRSRPALGELARHYLGTTALEAANRVRRLQLDAHRTPERGLQRLALIQRTVQKPRIDPPPSRADPIGVEARPLHTQDLSARAGSVGLRQVRAGSQGWLG